jgi:hypothetical protein
VTVSGSSVMVLSTLGTYKQSMKGTRGTNVGRARSRNVTHDKTVREEQVRFRLKAVGRGGATQVPGIAHLTDVGGGGLGLLLSVQSSK